jgi:hypothetical protein
LRSEDRQEVWARRELGLALARLLQQLRRDVALLQGKFQDLAFGLLALHKEVWQP